MVILLLDIWLQKNEEKKNKPKMPNRQKTNTSATNVGISCFLSFLSKVSDVYLLNTKPV